MIAKVSPSDTAGAHHRPVVPITAGSPMKAGMIRIYPRSSINIFAGLYRSRLCRYPIRTTFITKNMKQTE